MKIVHTKLLVINLPNLLSMTKIIEKRLILIGPKKGEAYNETFTKTEYK